MAPERKSCFQKQYYKWINVSKTPQTSNAFENPHGQMLPWYTLESFQVWIELTFNGAQRIYSLNSLMNLLRDNVIEIETLKEESSIIYPTWIFSDFCLFVLIIYEI